MGYHWSIFSQFTSLERLKFQQYKCMANVHLITDNFSSLLEVKIAEKLIVAVSSCGLLVNRLFILCCKGNFGPQNNSCSTFLVLISAFCHVYSICSLPLIYLLPFPQSPHSFWVFLASAFEFRFLLSLNFFLFYYMRALSVHVVLIILRKDLIELLHHCLVHFILSWVQLLCLVTLRPMVFLMSSLEVTSLGQAPTPGPVARVAE